MALCNPHIVRGSVSAALPAPAKLGSRASAVCRGALPGPSCRPRGAVRSARRDVRVLAAETGACCPHGALPRLCRADVCSVFLGRGPTSPPNHARGVPVLRPHLAFLPALRLTRGRGRGAREAPGCVQGHARLEGRACGAREAKVWGRGLCTWLCPVCLCARLSGDLVRRDGLLRGAPVAGGPRGEPVAGHHTALAGTYTRPRHRSRALRTGLTPPPLNSQPLSIAAIGRALWVTYKVTDKRVSVSSTSPFGGATPDGFAILDHHLGSVLTRPWVHCTAAEQLDASFSQMKEVRAIGRGVGYWVRLSRDVLIASPHRTLTRACWARVTW
jgi:hypothetical protein